MMDDRTMVQRVYNIRGYDLKTLLPSTWINDNVNNLSKIEFSLFKSNSNKIFFSKLTDY